MSKRLYLYLEVCYCPRCGSTWREEQHPSVEILPKIWGVGLYFCRLCKSLGHHPYALQVLHYPEVRLFEKARDGSVTELRT